MEISSPPQTVDFISKTPRAPYFAVIFTSINPMTTDEEYRLVNEQILEKAMAFPGFLGVESAGAECAITVSYWKDGASIKEWRSDLDHVLAQKTGRQKWYERYKVRICHVVREYDFESSSLG